MQPEAALIDARTLVQRPLMLVRGERIEAWIRPSEIPAGVEIEPFDGELWVAAPGMLHAHLESFDAPSAAWPRRSFAAWASALIRWRMQDQSRLTPAESAKRSWEDLQAAGCGFVAASVSEPDARARAEQVRNWPEIFEPDPELAEAVWAEVETQATAAHGVALHAPFSVSQRLASLAVEWVRRDPGRRLSIHLGEHEEERSFLRDLAGPLAELFAQRGRAMPAQRFASSVEWLESVAPGEQKQILAVHAGDLTREELAALERKKVPVVWCPGTHLYFDRPRPAFEQAGLPAPLLGCDSLASNESLDPLRELAIARRILPEYRATDWWEAATTRAAAALGWSADRGSLYPGCLAHPMRLTAPRAEQAHEVCEWLTSSQPAVRSAATSVPTL